MRDRVRHFTGQFAGWFLLLWALFALAAANVAAASDTLPASNRVSINLGETPWKYIKDVDDPNSMQPSFNDSAWQTVGVPFTPSDNDTFINTMSGGGQGFLTGNTNWYRKHFTLDASYANRKVFVEFEGAHTGVQVYINGQFIPGNSLINPNATHVIGFIPFIVDITKFLKFDGTDNLLAVKVSRGDAFFESPSFSGAYRFGQDDTGIFRPVKMFITDKVHIPENVYAVLNTWGTYVSTVAANTSVATIRVQTNVLNENPTNQQVTLTTQIVDATGNVVATAQDTNTVAASASGPLNPTLFDQVLTVSNPNLWYPNNSTFGHPYLYHVIHSVSVNGAVVDSTESPLGIRTITWDQNFPSINGHPYYLWGASGRYDYPALGSAVPEELQWRDLNLLSQAGGSLYRPGHSSQGPEFLDAADAYGVMMIQPSGDGENGFSIVCSASVTTGCVTPDNVELKKELHRDMIIHDRNHPSVLSWEADNGATDTSFAQTLKAISQQWDPVNTRVQSDRTPNPANGDILGCSGEGCDIGTKQQFPNSPAWGSEYWGNGVGRALYDFELAFAATYVNHWMHSVAGKSFGIAHWYLADTPGEINTQTDGPGSATGTANGHTPESVRGNGASMMDFNRLPRLLYYIYEAIWTPFEVKPVVKLANTWNRSGTVTVNAFSNCPSVRGLLNGAPLGGDQVPNPTTSDPSADLTESTTLLPGQVHWSNINFTAGTLTAECLDGNGQIAATDQLVTAGPADHIQLTVEPELVKPDGTSFALHANGTDAAIITATVVDANGVRVPDASQIVTFGVSGPGTYRGGADHYVTANQPLSYHSPGDPNLSFEGGLTRVVVKTQFTPGAVTVTASSPGLGGGTATFNVLPTATGSMFNGNDLVIGQQQPTALQIVSQPADQTVTAGQTGQFSVLTAGTSPTYQWMKNGTPIPGATSFTYTTPPVAASDNGATFSVVVSNATGSAGSVTSRAAVMTVVSPQVPSIVTPPAPQSITAGQSAEFTVVAAGSPVLTYQWLQNGTVIQGATRPVFDTPSLQTSDSGTLYSVVVRNSAGTVTSATAAVTVNAATAPVILSQPQSQSVPIGQAVTFNVLASGSAPLAYKWTKNGATVGTNSSSIAISSAQSTDAGTYAVTISNGAGSLTSTPATLTVSGGDASNLALGAIATASSVENGGLGPQNAVDGNLTTRWGSAFVDPSWIALDLGSVQTFDKVVLVWENAFGKAYQIQVSNDNQNWTTVFTQNAGVGGTETIDFPSTSARYVRMFGTQRGTTFGYSLLEFEVFDAPQCGASTERYTPLGAAPGLFQSPIAGLPSGPNVPTVKDNLSGLTWQQFDTTFPAQGAQWTQTVAAQYCAAVGMRLPTQNEALTIARSNFSACAFPAPWSTWTTTGVPNDPTNAFLVFSSGNSVSAIIDNTPGWSLCVSGPSAAAPVITAQPANQTVGAGQPAQFTVGVTGTGPLSFQWLKNGTTVAITSIPTFTTPPTAAADNGAVYSVVITNGGGTVTSATATLTVTAAVTPPPGGNPGGTPPGGGSTTPSANLALGKTATSSGDESTAFPASNAVDGNLNSRWSSAFVDPSWIDVDLGSAQAFDRVVLRWQDSFAIAYQIQVSSDNTNWTTVYTQTAGQGGTEDIRFPSTTARYVRMFGTQRATQFGYSLFEFEVYNTANTPQFALTATENGNGAIAPSGNVSVFQGGLQTYTFAPAAGSAVTGVQIDGQSIGQVGSSSFTFNNVQVAHTINASFGPASAAVNLALGKPATASGQETADLGPANAVDGNMNTRWSSAFVDPSWIQVDLGAVQNFNRVILFWQNAFGVVYQIQTSNDATNWTTVFTQNAGKGGIEDINFPTVNARYVRMFGTQRATPFGYSLFEFQVYNMPVAPVITTQPVAETVTQGQPATFTVAATGTAQLSYEWFENGTSVGTTTTPSFTTQPTVPSDNNATFTVVISNGGGSVTSAGATLTVKPVAPTITTQPAAETVTQGQSATFTVAATGTGLSYQWFENGTSVGKTATPSFTTQPTAASDNGATFTVVISNGGGSVTSAGATLTVNPPVATAPAASANLALGMTATASGMENAGDAPANAVDGNLGTRWSSDFNDNAWMTVDLGQPQQFDRVVLRWENAFGKQYLIETSNDNQTWTTAFTQNAGQGGTEDLRFTATTARYVRMQGVQRATQFGYSLFEFEVYNTANTPQYAITASATGGGTIAPNGKASVLQGAQQTYTFVPAAGSAVTGVQIDGQSIGMVPSFTFDNVQAAHTINVTFGPASAAVNLALNMPATASGLESNAFPASAAVDGNMNTRWSSAFVDPSWIQVDLGAAQDFNRVILFWQNAFGVVYQIQTSNDATNWTPVFTQNAGKGGVEDINFPTVNARYVRMFGTQRATPFGYSLFEFQVYNNNNTPVAPVITTQPVAETVTQGQSATFTVAATGTGLSYQWFENGTSVGTTTTPSFTTQPTVASDNGATFTVVISNNAGGSVTSAGATLTVNPPVVTAPAITTQPAAETVTQGQSATFTVAATGTGLSYQWFENGTSVGTTTTPSFTTQPTMASDNGATFTVVVSNNAGGSVTSAGATLTVNPPVVTAPAANFILQPAAQTVPAAQNGHFAVVMSGTGPFTYQWMKNGAPISGATSRTFDTPATTAADSGTVYSVTVAGPNGSPVTSNNATLTVNSTIPNYTVTPGGIGIDLQNNTNGAFTDDQVFVAVIAHDPATGQLAWLKPDGTIVASAVTDNDAPGHLTLNGQNYSNYFFSLAQSKTLKLPQLFAGRIFVSLGSPLYIKILADATGAVGDAQPNPQNPTDPNVNVNFDWYEFTYNNAALFINTTQVDEFGFPLLLDVYGSNHSFHMQTGIAQRRSDLFTAYANEVSPAFQPVPASSFRIMAPAKGSFAAGQPNGNFFDAYVNQIWSQYTTNQLVLDMFNNSRRFVGTVQNNQLVFTEVNLNNGAFVGGTYTVNKPTTQDILLGAGTLATGNTVELAIEAQICAAFNRHVMEDVTKWSTPSTWYAASPSNEYARFWHDHGISGLEYGFSYDDVSNQSSSIVSGQPEHMVLGIGF